MISLDAKTITLKWHSEWFHTHEIAIAATKESCEILNAEIRAVKMTSSLYYVISIFVAIPRKIFTPSFWKWKFPKLNNKSLMMSTAPHTEIISMLIRRIALHSITSQLPLFEPTYTLYHGWNERAGNPISSPFFYFRSYKHEIYCFPNEASSFSISHAHIYFDLLLHSALLFVFESMLFLRCGIIAFDCWHRFL